MKPILPQRNNSIDSFRLIVAIWVVFGHANFLLDINEDLHNLNRYICQVAVVYMLMVSGYYYIGALLKGKANFMASFTALFKTYLFWTGIYYAISFVVSVVIGKEPFGTFLIQRVIYFFFDGSFYHFWFFPALIYPMLVITLLHRLFGEKGIFVFSIIAIFLNILCAFGAGYSFIGMQIPVLSDLFGFSGFYSLSLIIAVGFSSYSAGYFAYLIHTKKLIKPKTSLVLLSLISILYVAESIFLVYAMNSIDNTKVFFMVYPMGLCMMLAFLNHPMPSWAGFAKYSRMTAGFVYYIHPLILLGLQMLLSFIGVDIGGILLAFFSLIIILPIIIICIKWETSFTRFLLGMKKKNIAK